MEEFKDFLYNKNDIIIALLILIIAAGVIYFRVKAIMAYPTQASSQVLEEATIALDFVRSVL